MEDLKNWKETAKDRRTERDLAEKTKTKKRVVVPNDDDNNVQVSCTSHKLFRGYRKRKQIVLCFLNNLHTRTY
jgi:hypothetical protein